VGNNRATIGSAEPEESDVSDCSISPRVGLESTTNGARRGPRAITVDLHELVFRLKGLISLRDANVFARAAVGEGGYSIDLTVYGR
jgi:hypothetical protein